MIFNKTSWIVLGSTLALIALIGFQVNWLKHSKKLIEAQFEQKVTMAMCHAVEMLRSTNDSIKLDLECGITTPACGTSCITAYLNEESMRDALVKSLNFYDIHLDFYFNVLPPQVAYGGGGAYCSPMESITNDDKMLKLIFKEKEAYVLNQMGFMTSSSIVILLFVCSLFILTLFQLIKQKQLHNISIAFFNNMAHEFRTPLTNIRMATNLIRRRQPEIDNRYLNIIQNEEAHLLEQVERILHIANLGKGNYHFKLEEIKVEELINKLERTTRLPISEKNGRLDIQYDLKKETTITGDQLHLSNAFQNLIDNSLKYNENQPIIEVKIENNGTGIYFKFKDNGIGINPASRSELFKPFVRGRKGDLYHGKGFGLGLAYVQQVVALHGGKIKINEQHQNGTQFDIWLPIHQQ